MQHNAIEIRLPVEVREIDTNVMVFTAGPCHSIIILDKYFRHSSAKYKEAGF